jgi:integrase/recombinase XerC
MFPSIAKKTGFPLDALINKYESENKITPAEKSNAKNYALYCLEHQYDLWITPFTNLKNIITFQMWGQDKHKVSKSQAGKFLKWCVIQDIFRVLPNTQKYMPLISDFLKAFLNEYDFNVRTQTRKTYENVLKQYEIFSEKQYGQLQFSADTIRNFRNDMIEREISPFTTNNYLSCLKTLSNWAIIHAERLNISAENVQELARICKIKSEKIDHSQYYKESLTPEQIEVLLVHITDIFDKTLFATMLWGGLRTIEVRRLMLQDIDMEKEQIWLLRKGKNTKKPYPITQNLNQILTNFFKNNQNIKANEYIFAVNYGYIWKKFRQYTQEIGFWTPNMPLRLSPHSCRHSAIQWIKNELGLEDAQQFAGHSNITSTMPYAQKTIQEQFAEKIKNI